MIYDLYFKQNIIPEWEYFYINYSLLKSIIKNEKSDKFLLIIESELKKINAFFNIIIKYDKDNDDINDFIIFNYMAIFKLIKKYDKHLCKNTKIQFFETITKQDFYSYYISRKRIQNKTKLVIFDKDGTLINNELIFAPWTEKIVTEFSLIFKFDKNLLYKHLGYDDKKKVFTEDSIVSKGTNDDIRNAITNFIKNHQGMDYNEARRFVKNNWCEVTFNSNNVISFGNTLELFKKLKKNNIKIAVCTSDDRNHTIKMLKILNVYDIVDKIACGDDLLSSKPSPEPIWEICKKLNVLPSQTIMIGDTISDIQAGINSRCKQVYGVLSGGYSSNYLQDADKIFNNITQAIDYILL